MQRLAREAFHCLDHGWAGSRRNAEAATVGLVADQRKADMGHVHADLVGAAGFQLDPYMGVRAEALEHPVVADGWLAAVGDRHALAHAAVATDRGVDLATGGDHPDDDALINAADLARLHLLDQLGLRLQGLGDHHQTGGVLVQAVNDTRTRYVDDVWHVVQQRIEQGAAGVPGSRVHDQPGGLVDDHDVVVFVDDIQFDIFCYPLTLGFLFGLQGKLGATVNEVARAHDGTIDRQAALFDPRS